MIDYGLFLAKTVTLVVAVVVVVLVVAVAARRSTSGADALTVARLNDRFDAMASTVRQAAWPKQQLKEHAKAHKQAEKQEKKDKQHARRAVFVLDFKGDMRASAVAALREEISAIVAMARDGDEVLLRLENPGGLVHDHGLAASQLSRLKPNGIRLTVAVDKVAASGGYMMACIADHIVAAPFAVLGSIGVLAQIPNFNRMLDDKGVDFELFKGGQFKRTVTMFGRNTDEDRAKFQQEINEIHTLFKGFVAENRPALELEAVATGEHWFGRDALKLGLCDELGTSDDWLMARRDDANLLQVRYRRRKRMGERLSQSLEDAPARALDRVLERIYKSRFER